MTLQSDLIEANREVAGKKAAVDILLDGIQGLEGTEAEERARSIKSASNAFQAAADRRDELDRRFRTDQLERAAVKAGRETTNDRLIIPDNDSGFGLRDRAPRSAGPNWGDAVVKAAEDQSATRGIKSMLPTGTAVVAVPVGGPLAEPRRARFLSELMPAEDAPGGHFSYLRQTVRTNNAAVVGEGGLKPTSVFTLERIDDTTDVIAHLSESLPRNYFDDSDKIRAFIESEMRFGIDLALDAKILSDLLATPGLLVEGDIGSPTFTCRRALTRLEEREIEPTCFVFHPRDWEQVEGAMTVNWTYGPFQPSPTDAIRRQLFGLPVIVTNALTENIGLVGDFRTAAALYRTGGVRVDWNESGDDFAHNLIKFRAETRAALAVYRPFAFVEINLAGTAS